MDICKSIKEKRASELLPLKKNYAQLKQLVLRNCPTIVFEGEAKGEVCPKVAMFGL